MSIALVVGRHAGSIFAFWVVRGSTIGGGRRGLGGGVDTHRRAVGGKRTGVGLYACSESGRQHLAQHGTNKKQAGLCWHVGPVLKPRHGMTAISRATWVVPCWALHSRSVMPTDGPHRAAIVGPCCAWPDGLGVKPKHGLDQASCRPDRVSCQFVVVPGRKHRASGRPI
jgi:hypothetical protein